MNNDKLNRAAALEAEAAALRKQAFEERPLPDFWRVGQKVRYLENNEWGWSAGQTAVILFLQDNCAGKPAREYQVFYTGSGARKNCSRFWTTPNDVELVEDVP